MERLGDVAAKAVGGRVGIHAAIQRCADRAWVPTQRRYRRVPARGPSRPTCRRNAMVSKFPAQPSGAAAGRAVRCCLRVLRIDIAGDRELPRCSAQLAGTRPRRRSPQGRRRQIAFRAAADRAEPEPLRSIFVDGPDAARSGMRQRRQPPRSDRFRTGEAGIVPIKDAAALRGLPGRCHSESIARAVCAESIP